MNTIEMLQHFVQHARIWPIIIRVAMVALHHAYHTACHKGLHVAGHKLHWLHKILAVPYMMDALLILALLAFGAVTEHETKE